MLHPNKLGRISHSLIIYLVSAFAAWLNFVVPLHAATYYVDFDAGNDASAGTSTGTAWQTIPGTRTTVGSAYLRSAWGPFNGSNKVPSGSTIQVKAGGSHISAAGGYIWINADYYQLTGGTVVIQSDGTWGTGTSATIDASGMTIGIAAMLIQVDGVTVRGLNINNSPIQGIQAKEKQGSGDALANLTFDRLTFFNNGTSLASDGAGAGSGQLTIRRATSCVVSNVTLNGDNNFINGIVAGDTGKTVSATISACTAYNHQGNNDCGIGFKAFNSQITYSGCISTANYKGFDLGEQSGAGANILYKVINSSARTNTYGINFNSAAGAYAGSVTWYAINNFITDNTTAGMNTYAAPHTLYVVNNVFDNNGLNPSGTPLYNAAHLITTPNTELDASTILVYVFNNIFRGQKQGTGNTRTAVILNKYMGAANDYTLTCDYNSYQQSGANTVLAVWSGYYGPGATTFDFGSNGPGHASGNWYSWYANSTTIPAAGTGHFRNDANSKGTGCLDTSFPTFNSKYELASNYPGRNLSTEAWYIAEMGLDRAGRQRVSWDMGAFDGTQTGDFQNGPQTPQGLAIIPKP